MKKITYGAGVFTIKNFLSKDECQEYIKFSEYKGYEEATIQMTEGAKMVKSVRNNDRVIFDDVALADKLYERVKPFLPDALNEWSLSGLNERFRFYRYDAGQYFKWHKDGFFCRTDDEVSLLTLMIYLNDDFEGGDTEFAWEIIKPETGMVLVFPHAMRHQGAAIVKGAKYVLRTDVMFTRVAVEAEVC